ncbi:sigma-70 family RNA polymerase sigma factor [Mediterraneibacter glycyrrhizinilyticus]|uniref:sigma-70 family RNA polymerase sigma factor n=1 Tax=Mediterraneibacter glycyrrhizinilyticus TaxID=342942 RepID=UPI002657D028|nr:sigma-70 family RNA polymerase sigma factor [Mediterraneibacter glycyrrhizinilyticus]
MYPAERKEGISLEHLVTKAQQGDGRAFVRLIEMNKQSMYKVARSYFTNDEDIADAIQDTIETCYRSISHLAEAQYFRTWLTRILINKCIDILRKNKREHPVSEFPEYGESSMELNNYEFNELMNSLDEKYRTILERRTKFEGNIFSGRNGTYLKKQRRNSRFSRAEDQRHIPGSRARRQERFPHSP